MTGILPIHHRLEVVDVEGNDLAGELDIHLKAVHREEEAGKRQSPSLAGFSHSPPITVRGLIRLPTPKQSFGYAKPKVTLGLHEHKVDTTVPVVSTDMGRPPGGRPTLR